MDEKEEKRSFYVTKPKKKTFISTRSGLVIIFMAIATPLINYYVETKYLKKEKVEIINAIEKSNENLPYSRGALRIDSIEIKGNKLTVTVTGLNLLKDHFVRQELETIGKETRKDYLQRFANANDSTMKAWKSLITKHKFIFCVVCFDQFGDELYRFNITSRDLSN